MITTTSSVALAIGSTWLSIVRIPSAAVFQLADAGDGGRLAGVIAWARANLDRQLPLDELAARALMSRRSFVRHFKAATGATPHAWLLSQRLSLAQELLETTSLPVEQIAERVGYRSAAVFREQFTARRGLAPRDYRRTFSRTT
jgi:transcriptional regulator GlxA family with amidase domain